jgi:hypothetical protein
VIPSQPVFALSPLRCLLSGEATHTNFKVFGLTLSGIEPTIYRTQGATDAVVYRGNTKIVLNSTN